MTTGTAPVCYVSPPVQFNSPSNPGAKLPALPTPDGTLAGLQASVMAIIMMLQMITGQLGQRSNGTNNDFTGSTRNSKVNQDKSKTGRWNEINRSTVEQKIFNPDDQSQYITVKQINSLTFQDSVTGEQWVWTRGS